MRVLYVADFVRDPNSGSSGSLLAIGGALADRGHHVDHLWKQPEPFALPHPSLSRWLELPRRQFAQVAAQLDRASYDVVMISQPYGYLAFERLPAQYPWTLFLNVTHGWEDRFNAARVKFAWDGPYSLPKRAALAATRAMVNQACRRTLKACHGLISPAQKARQYVSSTYGFPPEKVGVIPYGLDERFRSVPTRTDLGSGARMLYVGNYLASKGSEVIEKIVPSLGEEFPDSSITFVVMPDMFERIRAKFGPSFGDRLTLLSWRDRGELLPLYTSHDILLFPSLFEGFGKTFLEGMACGACVVGFNEGGLPDIAAFGREAFYCETGEVAALRALLARCLADPELTREIGIRAQHVARRYTWELTAQRVEAFCQQRRRALNLPVKTRHGVDLSGARP